MTPMNTKDKPNCQNCVHFREERSMRNSLGLPNTLGTAQALNTLEQNEQNHRTREVQHRSLLASRDIETWPFRPNVLSYCGFRENRDEYYVWELKNAGGKCTDYIDESLLGPRHCESCRHFVRATGYDQQYYDMRDILNQGTLTRGFEGYSDPSRITGDIDILMKSSQGNQSAEITEAMYNGGKLSHVPRFFDWCSKYSSDTQFPLCRFENHDGKCHGWER